MMYQFGNAGDIIGLGAAMTPFILLIALWSIFWKGLGLWHAAQRKQPWWFFFMLILNTAGILEIIYLFAVAKIKSDKLFK